jgi:hypothetical protein
LEGCCHRNLRRYGDNILNGEDAREGREGSGEMKALEQGEEVRG